MHYKNYYTNHILWSAVSRATIGRMTADTRRPYADDSLIECHRPTVWRYSADWRPFVRRPSAEIMMYISYKCRPTVRRSSGDHRPTFHQWQNQWKSADRSTKRKSRRPTKNQPKIIADVGRQSANVAWFFKILLVDRRPTVGSGNVTVVLVGTPSAIRPELASRRAEHSLSHSDVTIYIFDI